MIIITMSNQEVNRNKIYKCFTCVKPGIFQNTVVDVPGIIGRTFTKQPNLIALNYHNSVVSDNLLQFLALSENLSKFLVSSNN